MPHVGTFDVDLSLDAEALGDGEYATLVEALMGNGYEKRPRLRRFQLVRNVPATDLGPPIEVIVDFLMPRDAELVKIWRCASISSSPSAGRCRTAAPTGSRSLSVPYLRCSP
jgi:hypothetical protein